MTAKPDFIHRYINLAQPRLGAEVISATDEFFAPRERLIKPEEPVFIADKYDEHGKWMDGWESRRKRVEGHDYCVIRLCPGTIHGLDIDTRFFTGNYPPHASLEVINCEGDPTENAQWHELLPMTPLEGNEQHFIQIEDARTWTHARLHIYPDGGIARLRVYGVAHYDWNSHNSGEWADLIAMNRGGRALACNDMHYGHMSNLIAPGRGVNMGDGWETRRRRTPGNDWVMFKLGHPGRVRRLEVDTAFFKGNYPSHCSLHGLLLDSTGDDDISPKSPAWQELLPRVPLGPNRIQVFEQELLSDEVVSHIRFDIFPDGGVSRLRLFGEPAG
jgi:allantoicase